VTNTVRAGDAGAASPLPELVVPGPDTSAVERVLLLAGVLGERSAIEAADECLTYAELGTRIRLLAAEIATALEGQPGRPVGILAEQGTRSVAAMFAVYAAARPAVVLDSQLPEERLRQIAAQAGLAMVLVDDERRSIAEEFPGVTVRGLLPENPDADPAAVELPASCPDDPVSLVFTSGSTGQPKGVVWSNRTVLAIGYTCRITLELTAEDRVAMVLPQTFAAGQMLVFAALFNGGTLCVREPRIHGIRDMAEWLTGVRVTTLHLTPSLLRALVEALPAGGVLDSVRLVTTAGEKVYGQDVLTARPYLRPDATFLNWMGSSETADLTTFPIRPGQDVPDGVLPAGYTTPLRRLSVIGDDGTELPTGESGVLHVTSEYLSLGYWQDPTGTARVFTRLPDGQIVFRMGDRARIDEDGLVHLLGRVDDAVKIRGYLVEPQEIENALRGFPEVADAVVRALPGADGVPQLVAWVVPDPHHLQTPSPAGVRKALAELLPAYMVPTAVVLLAEIPRNERSKVDVKQLPPPPERGEPVPPATTTESELADIWAPILRLEVVGRDESFTALGGDSLAIEEMLAAVQTRFGILLTTADLAEHGSLSEFAELVDTARRGQSLTRTDTLVRLRSYGSRVPLFLFAGAGGAAALFDNLAAELSPDQPVYAFQVNGFENPGLPDWTINRAAQRYVKIINQVAPTGPVVLGGHSLGGLFTLRVAQLLGSQGREVPLVALLDTILPPAVRWEDGDDPAALSARLRHSRPYLFGNALANFLMPTTVRRRRREGAGQRSDGELLRSDQEGRPQRAYMRTRLRILTAGLNKLQMSERKDVFNLHGIGIAQFHRPQPWAGRALVFYSDENHDDPRWWDELLSGDHELHQIAAGHVAILKPPYVRQVAELLDQEIDRLPRTAPAPTGA
jgi:acyl-CoA synthetase (AMP-forming)/AMP-acid ligase II/thioesterase domain-containing protein